MSANPNANAASTYQTVVIAIVAGGILSTGVLSILWKRRQARRWIAMRRNMPPGSLGLRTGGAGGVSDADGLGRRPGIWDVVFGQEGKEGEGDAEKEGDGEEEDELDLEGKMKSGWKPASLSLSVPPPIPTLAQHSAKPPPPPSHSAEITVLIAMPQPPPSETPSSPSHPPPDYSPIYHYPITATPILNEYDEDERPLPILEMGITTLTVAPPSSTSKFSGLEDMLRKAAAEREEGSAGRQRSRSTAWDGIPVVQAPITGNGGFQGTGIDPLNSPSAASRYALIRNGALAGFGSPSGQRGVTPGGRA